MGGAPGDGLHRIESGVALELEHEVGQGGDPAILDIGEQDRVLTGCGLSAGTVMNCWTDWAVPGWMA